MDLGLLQRQVAEQIGVDKTTIHNWETKATNPGIHCLPQIIRFLGYNPLPPATTLAEHITRCRKTLGWSKKQLARHLGVDPSTVATWEAGRVKQPYPSYTALFEGWVASVKDTL